jgi:hypothetical protein
MEKSAAFFPLIVTLSTVAAMRSGFVSVWVCDADVDLPAHA